MQKAILDHTRLSEDIDFTLDRNLQKVREDIVKVVNNSELFGEINQDKDIQNNNRTTTIRI